MERGLGVTLLQFRHAGSRRGVPLVLSSPLVSGGFRRRRHRRYCAHRHAAERHRRTLWQPELLEWPLLPALAARPPKLDPNRAGQLI
jgi:hypothetical protein